MEDEKPNDSDNDGTDDKTSRTNNKEKFARQNIPSDLGRRVCLNAEKSNKVISWIPQHHPQTLVHYLSVGEKSS